MTAEKRGSEATERAWVLPVAKGQAISAKRWFCKAKRFVLAVWFRDGTEGERNRKSIATLGKRQGSMQGWMSKVTLNWQILKTMLMANERLEKWSIMRILRVYCNLHMSGENDEVQRSS